MIVWCSTPAGGGLTATAAAVSVLDHGFTVGDGVFETIKTTHGKTVAIDLHLARLARSAELLQVRLPPADHIRTALAEVTAAAECASTPVGRLRVTVTSGAGEPGTARGPGWTLAVVWVAAAPWPATTTLQVSTVRRNQHSPLSGAKTTSYAENALALHLATADGFGEALMLNLDGQVCEGTGSNIFAVLSGEVVTPPLSSGCLNGTTRQRVLALAKDRFPVSERQFTVSDLATASEVFITSATRGVQPVVAVGETAYSAPGPITSQLQKKLAESEEGL